MESGHVEANGVHTYYEVDGAGDPLLLLHGGLTTNASWALQVPVFAQHYRVTAPERRGHGHTPDIEGPITYPDMTTDTVSFIETMGLGAVHILGWSDGGMIGILLAARRPDLVRKLIVYGAGYSSEGYPPGAIEGIVERPADDPEMAMFRSFYEAATPDGADHFPVVLDKIRRLWLEDFDYGADVARITAPTLVLVADDDLITLDHATRFYLQLASGQLAVLPGTSHAACLERPELFNKVVLDFLAGDQPQPMMPYRRAPAG
jgi:pimeloyl-ACP methyl ester carboxylesterase